MEVPSDVQQLEPNPLGSSWSRTNQQNETEDRQGGDSDKAFTDELRKDIQPANQTADIKVSCIHPLLHISSCCVVLFLWVCLGVSEYVWWLTRSSLTVSIFCVICPVLPCLHFNNVCCLCMFFYAVRCWPLMKAGHFNCSKGLIVHYSWKKKWNYVCGLEL